MAKQRSSAAEPAYAGACDAHGCKVFPLTHQLYTSSGGAVGAAMAVAAEVVRTATVAAAAGGGGGGERRWTGYQRHGEP
eukprot:COSAG02_NODE_4243_length_5593_cov_32.867674_5_plen_79_part_00